MPENPREVAIRPLAGVLIAVAAVVAWRVAALVLHQAGSEETSLVIQGLLAVAGLTFLACGVLVFLKFPGRAGLLFAGYCICSGLHWGGPLPLAEGELRTALLLFYLLVSGTLGAALLLHLALTFPKASHIADRRVFVGLLYVPVVLSLLLAVVFLLSPSGSGVRTVAQEWFLLLHALVSNLFGLFALLLVASHLLRAGLNAPQKKYVALMVAGMLVAWLPYIVASSLGVVDTDPWNLTVVALPAAFALAFFGIRARA